jgi:hypothetical protein
MDNTQNKAGNQMAKTITLNKKWMRGEMVSLKKVSLMKSAAASMTLTATFKEDQKQQRQLV